MEVVMDLVGGGGNDTEAKGSALSKSPGGLGFVYSLAAIRVTAESHWTG